MAYQITLGALPGHVLGPEGSASLERLVALLDDRYSLALESPLQCYEPRVFVGVLINPGLAPWIIIDALLETWPHKIGVAVFKGVIHRRGRQLPGPALHTLALRGERVLLRDAVGEIPFRPWALLCTALIAGMSARQRGALGKVREGRSQVRVAADLGLSPQAVSRTLHRAGWPALRASARWIERSLN